MTNTGILLSEMFCWTATECTKSRGANLKKYVVKGDNWSIKGPTKNLYILIREMVLMTVWGGLFPNKWKYYGLP